MSRSRGAGIRQLLAAHPGRATIVGEARNGREAVARSPRLQPDVVFLDVQMPELDGFEVLQALRDPARVPLVDFRDRVRQVRGARVRGAGARLPGEAGHEARFDQALRPCTEKLHATRAASARAARRPARRRRVEPTVTRAAIRRVLTATVDPGRSTGSRPTTTTPRCTRSAAATSSASRSLARGAARPDAVRAGPPFGDRRLAACASCAGDDQGEPTLLLRDGTRVPVSRRRRERVAASIRRR